MRAIWTGAISFGLVHIPVKLYSGSESHKLDLDLIHKDDHCKIGYAYVCKSTGEKVEYKDVAKGYLYRDGEYVTLTKDDFERANPKKTKTIQIDTFVDEESVDPEFLVKPYYLAPDKNAEQVYALFREALKKSGKVGICQFVLRHNQHLGMLKAHEEILILDQMRYEEEIRQPDELKLPNGIGVNERQLELSLQLINQLSGEFAPEKYEDTYTEELKRVIEEKAQGKEFKPTEKAPQGTRVNQLLEQLEQSLAQIEANPAS